MGRACASLTGAERHLLRRAAARGHAPQGVVVRKRPRRGRYEVHYLAVLRPRRDAREVRARARQPSHPPALDAHDVDLLVAVGLGDGERDERAVGAAVRFDWSREDTCQSRVYAIG